MKGYITLQATKLHTPALKHLRGIHIRSSGRIGGVRTTGRTRNVRKGDNTEVALNTAYIAWKGKIALGHLYLHAHRVLIDTIKVFPCLSRIYRAGRRTRLGSKRSVPHPIHHLHHSSQPPTQSHPQKPNHPVPILAPISSSRSKKNSTYPHRVTQVPNIHSTQPHSCHVNEATGCTTRCTPPLL